MEKYGYDVIYCTDSDIHEATGGGGILSAGKHKMLMSGGHDEYWTWEMRDNVELAKNRPIQPLNLGFFGGNAVFWQARFKDGSSLRTLVAYKETAKNEDSRESDPLYSNANLTDNHLITNLWRENSDNNDGNNLFKLAEDELVGVMSQIDPPMGNGINDFHIKQGLPTWIKNGVSDKPVEGVVGDEADRVFPENIYARTLVVIGDSEFYSRYGKYLGNSNMTFYSQGNNSKVFAAGTLQWSWGLDNWGADPMVGRVFRPSFLNNDAHQLSRNIIDCLVNGACG